MERWRGALHEADLWFRFAAMKIAVAFAIYFLYGALLTVALVKAVAGSPWLLLAAVAVFLIGFVRFGCRTH